MTTQNAFASVNHETEIIRPCVETDFDTILAVINDAAIAYENVIPADRWHFPYMTEDELSQQISEGVQFWGHEKDGALVGVMGIQNLRDVTLIRHAYVKTLFRNQGIGTELLTVLRRQAAYSILIGTWAAAKWAIAFYQKNGFVLTSEEMKNRLLRKYWNIPERQVETSVVLMEAGVDKQHA